MRMEVISAATEIAFFSDLDNWFTQRSTAAGGSSAGLPFTKRRIDRERSQNTSHAITRHAVTASSIGRILPTVVCCTINLLLLPTRAFLHHHVVIREDIGP